jgi:hypothetical protein
MDLTDFQVDHLSQRPAFRLFPGAVSVSYLACCLLAEGRVALSRDAQVGPTDLPQLASRLGAPVLPACSPAPGRWRWVVVPACFPVNRRAAFSRRDCASRSPAFVSCRPEHDCRPHCALAPERAMPLAQRHRPSRRASFQLARYADRRRHLMSVAAPVSGCRPSRVARSRWAVRPQACALVDSARACASVHPVVRCIRRQPAGGSRSARRCRRVDTLYRRRLPLDRSRVPPASRPYVRPVTNRVRIANCRHHECLQDLTIRARAG